MALALSAMMTAIGAVGAFAQAAGEILITDPENAEWNFTGKGMRTKVVESEGAPGGMAIEANVARKGANPWDIQTAITLRQGFAVGDKLSFGFYARAVTGDAGGSTINLPIRIQRTSAPYDAAIEGMVTVGPEWKFHCISGPAKIALQPNEMNVSVQMAGDKRVVQLGPFMGFMIPASSSARFSRQCA
ncbi:hypothetical protein ACNI3Q_01795 [Sphingomonas sp. FW199]|uniref:hypothetical protein n=1 Tax=Sphingomonas sp. FW199 TaxID=3400217 RepID=UPI003CFB594D